MIAPALAQALEELHQRLILDHGRGLVMQMFAGDVELLRAAAARLRSAETRPDMADVLRVWNSWRQGMHLGGFTHSDGVRFVEALTALYANAAAPALPGETPAAERVQAALTDEVLARLKAVTDKWRDTAAEWERHRLSGHVTLMRGVPKPPESGRASIQNWENWLKGCADEIDAVLAALAPTTPQE